MSKSEKKKKLLDMWVIFSFDFERNRTETITTIILYVSRLTLK